MYYPLPIIQPQWVPQLPTIQEYTYHVAIDILDTINNTYNPCQINEQWTCIDHRNWNREAHNCCIKNLNKQSCSQLWPSWCTTKNITCKSYFCKTAQAVLSDKEFLNIWALIWIHAIRSILHNSIDSDKPSFHELYFQKEYVVREILWI